MSVQTAEERAHRLVERYSMDPGFGVADLEAGIASALRSAEAAAVVENKRVMQDLADKAIAEAERRGAERERDSWTDSIRSVRRSLMNIMTDCPHPESEVVKEFTQTGALPSWLSPEKMVRRLGRCRLDTIAAVRLIDARTAIPEPAGDSRARARAIDGSRENGA